MNEETAWLIELSQLPGVIGPEWLTSTTWHQRWPKEKAEVWKFSPDPNDAIRFSRKEDAQRILDILIAFCGCHEPFNRRDLIVTEHVWMDRQSKVPAE